MTGDLPQNAQELDTSDPKSKSKASLFVQFPVSLRSLQDWQPIPCFLDSVRQGTVEQNHDSSF